MRQPQRVSLVGPMDDREVVKRIAAGDPVAFASMVQAHYAALCGFANSYVHAPDVAEEMVQEVFAAIWMCRDTWAPKVGCRAYLFGAVRNRALGYVRHVRMADRQLGRWRPDDMPSVLGVPVDATDGRAEETLLQDVISRAVHTLPERRRLIVMLRWEHQMTHAEIAHTLGISVKGVENQLGRALRTLRQRLRHLRL